MLHIYSTMHIYLLQIDSTPPPIEHRSLQTITPHTFHIYSTMHIYPLQIDPTPLLQLNIDLWKTITPNMFKHSTMHIYLWQIDPLQLSIDALNTATPNLADIAQGTYTHGRLTHPLLKLSIDLWKTSTSNTLHMSQA